MFLCSFPLVIERTLSLKLSPPEPGSYNRNNDQLFCSVAENQTRFTKKKDSGGQGWALARSLCLSLSLSVSHKPTYTHICTHLWLPLSYVCPQRVGVTMETLSPVENGLDAVMRCWPKFIDPQDLVPVSEKNLVLHCWDLQSIQRNPWKQTWWIYTLEVFRVYGQCLCVISDLLFVPVDHS